jgi:SAM-dependent methyltransferase
VTATITGRGHGVDAADPTLTALLASGLALDRLPGNSAKIRLALDLAGVVNARGHVRALDVGCAGRSPKTPPLNVWEPLVPLAEGLDLLCTDVADLGRVEARARELGLAFAFERADALQLRAQLGAETFDVVVSTQVLEHVREWERALAEMRAVLRPGGVLLLTCDAEAGRRRSFRLAAKRIYSRLPSNSLLPWSGEWERGIACPALARASTAAGFVVDRIGLYGLRDVKRAQADAGPATRMLWLALEEAIARESTDPDPTAYTTVYLRARVPEAVIAPPAPGRSPVSARSG